MIAQEERDLPLFRYLEGSSFWNALDTAHLPRWDRKSEGNFRLVREAPSR